MQRAVYANVNIDMGAIKDEDEASKVMVMNPIYGIANNQVPNKDCTVLITL